VEGAHDLGGLDGFGPVVTADGELTHHEPWELRAQGVALFAVRGGMRPWIERLDPVTYVTSSYYVRWLRAAELGALAQGAVTPDDLARWQARFESDDTARPPVVVDPERRARVEAALTTAERLRPALVHRFGRGDRVRVLRWHDPEHHHRCPRYVRGAVGVVETAWGEERVPGHEADDEWAPTYTVTFGAAALWGATQEGPFTVSVDLCEHYLEAAP
jgi:nitrile hydratase